MRINRWGGSDGGRRKGTYVIANVHMRYDNIFYICQHIIDSFAISDKDSWSKPQSLDSNGLLWLIITSHI